MYITSQLIFSIQHVTSPLLDKRNCHIVSYTSKSSLPLVRLRDRGFKGPPLEASVFVSRRLLSQIHRQDASVSGAAKKSLWFDVMGTLSDEGTLVVNV